MANPYFTSAFNALAGSRAQARAVDYDLEQIQAAFDAVYADLLALGAGGSFIGSKPDVPVSYAGQARRLLGCNVAETGLEFFGAGSIPIKGITSSRSLLATDFGHLLICDSATDMTLTVEPNATTEVPTESVLVVCQWGVGKVTLAPGAGVTLRAAGGLLSTRAQFSQITMIKVDSDDHLVGGDRA